ncbi:MAG: DUF58 domain-containing protein [Treponema sp.]|nr:DUF58 domain-containing protein [Treponema sp.]
MEAADLLRNIINLPMISSTLANEMLSGNFKSIFKGQGMEFDEARHYEPGDDIRSIDWNASARFGNPFVKMYREERELTILILLDVSPSMHRTNIARHGLSPYEQGLITAALIAFSAEHTGQQVGAFFFDKDIEKAFLPRKGRKSLMTIVMSALQYQDNQKPRKEKRGSDIKSALTAARRYLKKRSLVVLISDFYSLNWEDEMSSLCRNHDCIAIRICSPQELLFPGLITLEDPETGIRIEAPAGINSFKESWAAWHNERATHWESQCRKCGSSFLELSTEADAPSSLLKFFGSRNLGLYRKRNKKR